MTGRIVRYLPQLAFASDSDVEPVLRYVDPYVSLTLTFHFPTTSFVEIAGVGPLLRYPSLCSFNRSGSTPELRARRPQLPVGVCHQRFQDGLPSPSPTPYFTTYKRVRERGTPRLLANGGLLAQAFCFSQGGGGGVVGSCHAQGDGQVVKRLAVAWGQLDGARKHLDGGTG